MNFRGGGYKVNLLRKALAPYADKNEERIVLFTDRWICFYEIYQNTIVHYEHVRKINDLFSTWEDLTVFIVSMWTNNFRLNTVTVLFEYSHIRQSLILKFESLTIQQCFDSISSTKVLKFRQIKANYDIKHFSKMFDL